jgi:hypothetical protein
MILVYVTNKRIGEVRDLVASLREGNRVSYRNPTYWRGRVEKCDQVYVHGEYPKIKEAYSERLIEIQDTTSKDSTDYTIAELRKMKPDIEDWESFTANDDRKSIDRL